MVLVNDLKPIFVLLLQQKVKAQTSLLTVISFSFLFRLYLDYDINLSMRRGPFCKDS